MTARQVIEKLVDAMRRSDPEYVASHGCAHTTDDEWDDVLAAGEEWLDDDDAAKEKDRD